MNTEVKKDILEETIKTRRKLPKEIKDNISNNIFSNIVMFAVMSFITLGINVMYYKFSVTNFEKYMKIVQIAVCLISIAIFEYSYKKDSLKKSLYGIEFVIFSVAVLYVPYMFILKNRMNFLRNILILFFIYYIIKSIFVFVYTRKKYLKENISDVKEILKDEKKGYLDEESKKKYNK